MKRVGLVLSGGMGKGAYQIGALSALCQYFDPDDFEFVSAASIGVLNTYAFLTHNIDAASDMWKSVDFQKNKSFITSVLKSNFLQDIISDIATDTKINCPFYVPLLDLANRELFYYDFSKVPSNEIEQYLRASVAMPLYNKGVNIDGKTLYDGAVVDNIPICPILKNDFDYIICIYFDDKNYVFEDYSLDNRIIKLTFPDDKFISNSVQIKHDSIMYMIKRGYEHTEEILSEIFTEGVDNLPVIYSNIATYNSYYKEQKMRVTGDVVVTNINKLVKRLVRQNKGKSGDNDGYKED